MVGAQAGGVLKGGRRRESVHGVGDAIDLNNSQIFWEAYFEG
jgi:hypothetical protein